MSGPAISGSNEAAGGHGHGHGGTRAIVAAFFANLGIAVAKFVAFLFTRSASMLAESVHSLADTGNQGLLLLGGRRAKRAPTEEHPFGFGTERYFWAFVVAVVLFTVGAAFAVIEGIEKIREPHELESAAWAIGVLLVAIALESFSFRTALVEANRAREGQSLWQFVRGSKSPELPVVLLEDTAALLGLLIALAAVGMTLATDDAVWDGYGTLSIGILLGVVAIILAVEMKSLLIGEAASPGDLEAIRAAVGAEPDVLRIIHLRTLHMGPEEVLVAAKVELRPELRGAELADTINRIEGSIRAAVPDTKLMIFVEPDVFRTANAPVDEESAAH
jgi:cation diffusion facilitator family transporter